MEGNSHQSEEQGPSEIILKNKNIISKEKREGQGWLVGRGNKNCKQVMNLPYDQANYQNQPNIEL